MSSQGTFRAHIVAVVYSVQGCDMFAILAFRMGRGRHYENIVFFLFLPMYLLTCSGRGNLATWYKHPEPFLALPPSSMPLVGWRDPYIFEFKGKNGHKEWGMLLGSGLKNKGGAIMIYRSDDLHYGADLLSSFTSMCTIPDCRDRSNFVSGSAHAHCLCCRGDCFATYEQ